uniref:DUF4283 domain protein n=1 Tax=Toxocara canis TaxID=6265 RepID=A0A183UXP8_TOXCA
LFQDGFKCADLVLKKIEYASVWVPPVKVIEDPHVDNVIARQLELSYRVVVRVKPPSDALLEGVVVKDLKNNEWKVTGEIERNNK